MKESKEFILYFISKILSGIINYVITFTMGYLMGINDFGKLSIITLIVSIMPIFIGWGFTATYSLKYFKIEEEEKSSIVNSIFIYSLLVTMIFIIIVPLKYKFVNRIIGTNLNAYCYIILILIGFFTFIYEFLSNIHRLNRSTKRFVQVQITYSLLLVVFNISLVYILNDKILGYLLGLLVANASISIYLLKEYINKYYKGLILNINKFKQLYLLSVPIVINFIFSFILNYADRYIIQVLTKSFALVGIYFYGYKIGELFNSFCIVPFINTINPIMLEEYAKSEKNFYTKLEEYIILYIILFSVFFSFLSFGLETIIIHIIPKSYSQCLIISKIVSIGYFIYGISQIINFVMLVNEKILITSITNVCAAVINIILNFIFIPRMGIKGAAITTLISYSIVLAINYKICSHISYKNINLLKNKRLIFSIVVLVIILLINININIYSIKKSIIKLIVSIFIIGLIYIDKLKEQELTKFYLKINFK